MELKVNNKKILVSTLTFTLLMGCGESGGFIGSEKQPVETGTSTEASKRTAKLAKLDNNTNVIFHANNIPYCY